MTGVEIDFLFTDEEHQWAKKKLRSVIAASGTSDEELDRLGQLYYDKILSKRRSSWASSLPKVNIALPKVELPSFDLRKIAQAATLAIATIGAGYLSGSLWYNRFVERSTVIDQLIHAQDDLRRFSNYYDSSDDPSLRHEILGAALTPGRSLFEARKRLNELDGESTDFPSFVNFMMLWAAPMSTLGLGVSAVAVATDGERRKNLVTT